jgi:hypothetical protein
LKHLFLALSASLPLLAQYPAPALLTGLGPKFTQEIVKTAQLSCADLRAASCYSDFIRAADGGNKYDNKGNLYLAGGTNLPPSSQAITMMDPNGNFSTVALLTDANVSCANTASGAVYTGKNIAGFAFNPGINALYVVTTSTASYYSGTCALLGPLVNFYQTVALLRLK